jgi:hypothetical protein
MTPRENFKIAFMARCVREGLNFDEMTERAKEAADKLAGVLGDALSYIGGPAVGGGVGHAVGSATGFPNVGAALGTAAGSQAGRSIMGASWPLLVAAPLIAGGLGGYGLARATDVSDDDIQGGQRAPRHLQDGNESPQATKSRT